MPAGNAAWSSRRCRRQPWGAPSTSVSGSSSSATYCPTATKGSGRTRSRSATNASAQRLGQRQHDALGASEVAEPILVLVLHHLADELGAVGDQAGDDRIDKIGRA